MFEMIVGMITMVMCQDLGKSPLKNGMDEKEKDISLPPILCKCNSPEEWKKLSDTPVAWLILTHDITMERTISLLHRIWRPHHTYVVHVDKSVPHSRFLLFVKKIKEQFQKHDNILAVSEVKGGHTYELVEIELRLIDKVVNPWVSLKEMDRNYQNVSLLNSEFKSSTCGIREWKYAVILSGDSYPLQDVDVIVRRISSWDINQMDTFVEPNFTYHRFLRPKYGKEILEELASAYQRCGEDEKVKQIRSLIATVDTNGVIDKSRAKALPTPVYWGSQWVVLTRNFAEYSVTSEFARKLFEVMKHVSYAADEGYFQNLLHASCRDDFAEINSTHNRGQFFMLTAWREKEKVITKKFAQGQLSRFDAMFVRKVRDFDTEKIIETLIPKSRNHESDFKHYCFQ